MGLLAREIAKLPIASPVTAQNLEGSIMARSSNPFRLAGLRSTRRGSALILTALAIIPLLAILALAVDWGRVCVTKAELQRAADSAAMAAAWELKDAKGPGSRLSGGA